MIFRFTYFCLVLILVLPSCNDCNLIDCQLPVSFSIHIDDELTGNSLLIESDSLYHIDDMSITSLVDGEEFAGQLFRSDIGHDSIPIICFSNAAPDMMLLKLNQNEIDTLRFISEEIEGECCDVFRLDSVAINGGEMQAVLGNSVAILK